MRLRVNCHFDVSVNKWRGYGVPNKGSDRTRNCYLERFGDWGYHWVIQEFNLELDAWINSDVSKVARLDDHGVTSDGQPAVRVRGQSILACAAVSAVRVDSGCPDGVLQEDIRIARSQSHAVDNVADRLVCQDCDGAVVHNGDLERRSC